MVKDLAIGQKAVKSNPLKVVQRQRHNADWPGIRLMYATGVSIDKLAEKTGIPRGTIANRSVREAWEEDRVKLRMLEDAARDKSIKLLATMPERAKDWVSRVAAQSDKSLTIIEKEPMENLRDVTRVTSALDHVDKVARRSLGLDEENAGSRTIVNLGFLQDYQPAMLESSEKPLVLENAVD